MGEKRGAENGSGAQRSGTGGGVWQAVEVARGAMGPESWQPAGGLELPGFLRNSAGEAEADPGTGGLRPGRGKVS